jgi:hypothetical protein
MFHDEGFGEAGLEVTASRRSETFGCGFERGGGTQMLTVDKGRGSAMSETLTFYRPTSG